MALNNLLLVFILVILTELTTELIIKSSILSPIRYYFMFKSKFFMDLLSCGYCFSVWSSLFWCLVFEFTNNFPNILNNLFLNFIVILFISHRFSNILHGLIDRHFDTRKDIRYTKPD